MLGTVSLVVGLSTVAFTVGGGSDSAPGPRITPSVEMYSVEHAITTGEVPFDLRPAQAPAPARPRRPRAIPPRRSREVEVFTPSYRLSRSGRSPCLLAAALAMAVPGLPGDRVQQLGGRRRRPVTTRPRRQPGPRGGEPGPGAAKGRRAAAEQQAGPAAC